MKKLFLRFILLFFVLSSCKTTTVQETPKAVPVGTWKYTFIVYGMVVGETIISNELNGQNYIITSFMNVQIGKDRKTVINKTLIETIDFKPVKHEMNNNTTTNGITQQTSMSISFENNNITVVANGQTEHITLDKPYILGANYFTYAHLQQGYKIGNTVEADCYIPTLELEDTIRCKETVVGIDEISINGKQKKLIKIKQEIDGVELSNTYVDETGIVYRTVISTEDHETELILVE